MAKSKMSGQLIAGIIIAAIGVLLVFERFLDVVFHGIWHLWPLILVVIGLTRLGGGDGERKRPGIVLIVVGLWLLINTQGLFDLDWGTSWPLLLIGLGLSKLIIPDQDGRSGGLLLLLIGLWASINVFELWGLYWENSWPLAIIIVGLVIVWKALFEGGNRAEDRSNDNS